MHYLYTVELFKLSLVLKKKKFRTIFFLIHQYFVRHYVLLYEHVLMYFRCKFGQLGPGKGQFNSPHGFCLGIDEDIVVADTNNHRIQVFEKTGEFKCQFGIPGNVIL